MNNYVVQIHEDSSYGSFCEPTLFLAVYTSKFKLKKSWCIQNLKELAEKRLTVIYLFCNTWIVSVKFSKMYCKRVRQK